MTEQQKQAVEEAAKEYALKAHQSINDIGVSDIKALVYDYMSGMHQVINFPEKYGLQPINEWVSVKDRLPDELERVWVCLKSGAMGEAIFSRFRSSGWFRSDGIDFVESNPVTHWMLPQPPINEREEG